ncbi:2-dehydro-3-deoxygalactonokinase [Zobellia uliginosa]|uniref:2-dehydro-3-deoxygalactonokinase n=1 Tax=Zobellia uliginosa TaxID=143224 RepID=A0ABY1L1J6_9FLAO|nr:2-dehydro-3-deoxygalactonokinase [Zobellia uliginosa]SIT10531.1 2-dehydro-3-deoxygalactonokinase [Zobellia uliginosa]
MKLPKNFISCDWGTSNFRLRWVDTDTLDVLCEHTTDMGTKKRFQQFKSQSEMKQDQFFAAYLKEQLKALNIAEDNDRIIVASGMLSSSIGMKELSYAPMPFSFDGMDLSSEFIPFDSMPNVLLVSGVSSKSDVMRGEEIQAVGLAEELAHHKSGTLLLPGTHSKHIRFEKGIFKDFTTFMTGELFEIISRHSILSASLEPAQWETSFQNIFLEGVEKGLTNQCMPSLFSIRANTLLNHISGHDNYFYLSGLLIGAEITNLQRRKETVFLAASGIYNTLYKLALASFLPKDEIICFEERILEKALLKGQKKILETYAE